MTRRAVNEKRATCIYRVPVIPMLQHTFTPSPLAGTLAGADDARERVRIRGASKLRDPRGFPIGVLEYEILPRRAAKVFAPVLPFADLGVALGLLLCS